MPRINTPIGKIPVGGCLPWMSPTAGSPQPDPPVGWEYADGGTVSTVGSLLFGLTKPALMRTVENPGATPRFVRGADTTATYGGATAFNTGGVATHTHSIQADGDHTHTGNTDSQGAHAHGGAVNSGGATTTSTESSNQGGLDLSLITGGSDTVALSHDHTVGNHLHAINSDGSHTHTLTLNTTGSHTHTADITNNEPPYVDMAWIIRVL